VQSLIFPSQESLDKPGTIFPARKSSSARIFACKGSSSYTALEMNISSARDMREMASLRLCPADQLGNQ